MMAKTGAPKYYEGHGSRKTATSRVRLFEGKGATVVNGKPVEEVYTKEIQKERVFRPIVTTGLADKVYFTAKSSGGGTTGQLDAIVLGLARAILKLDDSKKEILRKEGLLTRDTREVERKKVFLRKARKRPQYSKR